MGSVREENENGNGEPCGHRKGIRVTSVNALRRRIRRKTAMKCCCCCCCRHCVLQYPSLAARAVSVNDFLSTIPTHAVFIFLNPLMVDLLQVKFQGKIKTPFETHEPNMWVFFVATCVHCLGLAFEMKIQTSGAPCCTIFSNLVLFSGALSSLSLASVFLPRALGWVCLGLWTLFPFAAAFPFLFSASKWLSNKMVEFIKSFTPQKLCLPK